jgi:phosphoribosylanthranilate isomerase
MPLDIKICGLKKPESVAASLAGGATHLGFIFFEKSPRHVTPGAARDLSSPARGSAVSVAVTVDATDEYLDEIVAIMRPAMLQLHGHETPQRVAFVRHRHCLPVMKAFSLRSAADLAAIAPYKGVADRFLFDAKPPQGAELPGGNGVPFDWSLLDGLDADLDYMLSGGINAANAVEAIARTRCCGLDVSSGVESAPGVKDERLISEFLALVRKAERAHAAPMGMDKAG